MDRKLNLDVSLAGLSWPLFIGGQVSRIRSVRYKLHIAVYTVISMFDYNYTLASVLGLYFYGLLPEPTSGLLIQQALVVIPLSVSVRALERIEGLFAHAPILMSTGTIT
jgi:hypothetical protein